MRACPRCHLIYRSAREACGVDGERLAMFTEDPLIGTVVGRYRIAAPLGAGGMASVYRALDPSAGRDVAIKVLYGEVASDSGLAARFCAEAGAASKLQHGNAVAITDFGTTP